MARKNPHLYTHGGKRAHIGEFQARYGKEHGKEVYGAVVGLVKRARMAKGLCSVRGCGAPSTHRHGKHHCCGNPIHHDLIRAAHMAGVMTG
jgi:hypothetical protein